MSCTPHRSNAKRRLMDAIATLSGTPSGGYTRRVIPTVRQPRGRWRLTGTDLVFAGATFRALSSSGLIEVDVEGDDVRLTPKGIEAIEVHEEEHRRADAKAREAGTAAAAPRAATAGVQVAGTAELADRLRNVDPAKVGPAMADAGERARMTGKSILR